MSMNKDGNDVCNNDVEVPMDVDDYENDKNDCVRRKENSLRRYCCLHGLVNYIDMEKPGTFAHSRVETDRLRSVLYVRYPNEQLIRRCCALIGYVLRARFQVTFDREPADQQEFENVSTFLSIPDFSSYAKNLFAFMSSLRDTQRDLNVESIMNDTVFQSMPTETRNDLRRFLYIRDATFDAFMEVFDKNGRLIEHDNVYARLFVDRTLSYSPPLVVPMNSFRSLYSMFDIVCQVTVKSLDYANSLHYVVLTFGVFMSSLLILMSEKYSSSSSFSSSSFTSEEDKNNSILEVDTNNDDNDNDNDNDDDDDVLKCWGKVRLSQEEVPAAWFLTNDKREKSIPAKLLTSLSVTPTKKLNENDNDDKDANDYDEDVVDDENDSGEPVFDRSKGDTYVDANDFLATLIAQSILRIYTRFLEWPQREDVAPFLARHVVCDNYARFFHERGGRQGQQSWINFRKKRNADGDGRSARVYIRLEPLISLYDELISSFPKDTTNQSQQQQQQHHQLQQQQQQQQHSQQLKLKLDSSKEHVKNQIESLQMFHADFVKFWNVGVRDTARGQEFRSLYAQELRNFIVASGGVDNYEDNHNEKYVESSNNDDQYRITTTLTDERVILDVELNGNVCVKSSNSDDLIPLFRNRKKSTNDEDSLFSLKWWLSQVYHRVFPVNHILSAWYMQQQQQRQQGNLRQQQQQEFRPWSSDESIDVLILQLSSVNYMSKRRILSSKIRKLLNFFSKERYRFSFLITQLDLVGFLARLNNECDVLKDLIGDVSEITTDE